MTRLARIAAAMLALLALSSCSRSYPVRAAFLDGRLVFLSEELEENGFPWCTDWFAVVDDQGAPAWQFTAWDLGSPERGCAAHFPLAYGDAPTGAESSQPARRLQIGRAYLIQGSGGLEGAFILYRSGDQFAVVNLDVRDDHVAEISRRFLAGDYRRSKETGGNRAMTESGDEPAL